MLESRYHAPLLFLPRICHTMRKAAAGDADPLVASPGSAVHSWHMPTPHTACAAASIHRAERRLDMGRRLTYLGWRLIAQSQKRLSTHGMRGGAAEPLHDKIRMALAASTLPCIDGQAWAGAAAGERACACCGLPIRAREIEYEPCDQAGLYAHYACFAAWRAESARLSRAADEESGRAVSGA
jgi:hypothetical protein